MRRSSALLIAAAATASSAAFVNDARAQTIVVTAERREQETSTLAANAAVITGEELEAIAPQAPSEALNRLPGVAIHRNNGVENLPAIRSPVLVGGQSAGSFLVLEDGVPIRAPGFANVNQLFETSLDFAERVEVVRGPGSALYGSNAVHGIVNIITQIPGVWEAPDPLKPSFSTTFDAGSFERYGGTFTLLVGARPRVSGYVINDIPVQGEWGSPHRFGVSIGAVHEGGWRDESGLDRQAALLGWDSGLVDRPWTLETRLAFQNLNQESAGFIEGPNAFDDTALARSNPVPEAYRDAQSARARVTLLGDFRDRNWSVAFTPYARWIDADLNLFFFPSRAQEITRQVGGGLQGSAYYDPSELLSLIFGADVDRTRGSVFEFQRRATQPNGYVQGLHYDYDVNMSMDALYAQATWQFSGDWRIVAGARGEWVEYEYDNKAPDGDLGRFRRPPDRIDSFESFMPKLGVVWSPTGDDAVWLNYARGSRPPQITDLYSLQTTQVPGEQGVETIDSVELGWRRELEKAGFEVALYHMDKRDTSFRNADGFTVTDGKTRHQGIEVSGNIQLTDDIAASGWIAYARHTYRFNDPVSRAGESISVGDDVDSAPRWIWNARLAWRPLMRFGTELEWVHMGEYFTNAANTRTYPGHDVVNLRADWEVGSNVELYAAIRNLTNTDYAERADFAFGNDRFFPGEDRAFTLGVRAQR